MICTIYYVRGLVPHGTKHVWDLALRRNIIAFQAICRKNLMPGTKAFL